MRELEFLPADYIRARYQRRIRFIRTWLLLALGMAMVLWSYQVGAWVQSARAELMALQSSDLAIDADVEKVRNLQTESDVYDRRLEMLRLLKAPITMTSACATLGNLVPNGVVLDDMLLQHPEKGGGDRATLRIVGIADSEASVTQALQALESSPGLAHVTLVESRPMTPTDGPKRSFTVEADVVAPTKE